MEKVLTFYLNDKKISGCFPEGMVLLDLLRESYRLTSVKEGCREGDCGACLVLIGSLQKDELNYRTVNSCLYPVGEIQGKQVITLEGLNGKTASPLQQAFIDEGASQCGFCTPGFLISLTGYLVNTPAYRHDEAIRAMDGNICRCTGYKSIERATLRLQDICGRPGFETDHKTKFLQENGLLPAWFGQVKSRLQEIAAGPAETGLPQEKQQGIAGGSDLLVQKPEALAEADLFYFNRLHLTTIHEEAGRILIGAGCTVQHLLESELLRNLFPDLPEWLGLISSTPIRNRATVAGNLVNASPIADLAVFFLALDAELHLRSKTGQRLVSLRHFYKGYKVLDLLPQEIITSIDIPRPPESFIFNFEKIAKRKHLDIASVNSACCLQMQGDIVLSAAISAGGVGPFPRYLAKTSSFWTGRVLTGDHLLQSLQIADGEISTIDDVRGSGRYKRLLLRQLLTAHFLKVQSDLLTPEALYEKR